MLRHRSAPLFLITMAGVGRRFREAGFELPKPLVPVRGKPMFTWAIANLPQDYRNYVFVCRQSDIDRFSLDAELRRHTSDQITVVSVLEETGGQACTALAARHLIGPGPLIIHNSDTFFDCDLSFVGASGVDGAIPYMESHDAAMSYLDIAPGAQVRRIVEKQVISSHASIGLYYFASGDLFAQAAASMIERRERSTGEYYISPVYNDLIASGSVILGVQARWAWDLGTPEKRAAFESLDQGGYSSCS